MSHIVFMSKFNVIADTPYIDNVIWGWGGGYIHGFALHVYLYYSI